MCEYAIVFSLKIGNISELVTGRFNYFDRFESNWAYISAGSSKELSRVAEYRRHNPGRVAKRLERQYQIWKETNTIPGKRRALST